MHIKWFLILILILGISLFAYPIASYADMSCQPIYGGGQTCVTTGNFVIDKKILNTQTNAFVDNLGVNDMKFEPGNIVNFQISVTNNGTTSQTIDVKDIFPQYLNFETGPGSFDPNTKNLTFTANNLKPDETRTFKVNGRIVDSNQISISQGFVCVVNQATATNPKDTSQTSQDNSQFCIEKKVQGAVKGGFPVLPVTPVYSTPATGSETLALISLIPTAIAGWLLRKYTYKKIKTRGGE